VTAATPTTIRGVSLLTPKRRADGAVFDIALSSDGIEIMRPGRPVQKMTWDRISAWEIEEHDEYVLLTLRGGGATTPIVVRDWTLDDLEVVMREVTTGTTGVIPASESEAVVAPGPAPAVAQAVAPVPAPAPAGEEQGPQGAQAAEAAAGTAHATEPPAQSRSEWRRRRLGPRNVLRGGWRAVVTVVLLGLLAVAVTLVLLQSAGVIKWGFLGPVA
jgi:nucleoid-associated protein YgaU